MGLVEAILVLFFGHVATASKRRAPAPRPVPRPVPRPASRPAPRPTPGQSPHNATPPPPRPVEPTPPPVVVPAPPPPPAELPWLTTARSFLGMKEIAGKEGNNEDIVDLWDEADGKDDGRMILVPDGDETPWCAAFVSVALEKAGIRSKRTGRARDYLEWGEELNGPAVGAVVVFERGAHSGHVGFVMGRTKSGQNECLAVLGGNQGDQVKISPFVLTRVLSYRWPAGQPKPESTGFDDLPKLAAGGKISTNEA